MKQLTSIQINDPDGINTIAFTADETHIVSGDRAGKIRLWKVEDGTEAAGPPIDAESSVSNIAASRDGEWVVSVTESGELTVWNAKTWGKKVIKPKGNDGRVWSADISLDSTKIASGSYDGNIYVWSLSTGEQLLGPLKHDYSAIAIKFSPDGQFIATATWDRKSVRVYDTRNGRRLANFSISVWNLSLVWTSDSKCLFASSRQGEIRCVGVPSGETLSKWAVDGISHDTCIALAGDGALIAVSVGSSISFWDTVTHKQVASDVIHHPSKICSMAITLDKLAVSGDTGITLLRNPLDVILPPYLKNHIKAERAALEKENDSLRTQQKRSHETISDLEQTVQDLRAELMYLREKTDAAAKTHLSQIEDIRTEHVALEKENDLLRAQQKCSNEAISDLEQTVKELRAELTDSQDKTDAIRQSFFVHQQKHQCEALYSDGRVIDAAQLLLTIKETADEDTQDDTFARDWFSIFTQKCITTLEDIGDETSKTTKHDEALAAYSAALSLDLSAPGRMLAKWARIKLLQSSPNEMLGAATQFNIPRYMIYHVTCDILQEAGRIKEAIGCFRQMQSDLTVGTDVCDERVESELGFQQRCMDNLQTLVDVAMESCNYSEAVEHLSTLLSLNPLDRVDFLSQRSRAWAKINAWKDALADADEVIVLDPLLQSGYELRHAALHGLEESSDEHVPELRSRYVDVRLKIQECIDGAIRHIPWVVVDTMTGQQLDKKQQAEAFKAHPMFNELVSSVTREVNDARIQSEVKKFYQYKMFSQTWRSVRETTEVEQHDIHTFSDK